MKKLTIWLVSIVFMLLLGIGFLVSREDPVVTARNAELVSMGFPKNVRLNDCEFETMKNLKVMYTIMGSDNDYWIECDPYSALFILSDASRKFVLDIRVTNPSPKAGEPVYFIYTVYEAKDLEGQEITGYLTCTWNFGSGVEQSDGSYVFDKSEHVSLTCTTADHIKIMSVMQIVPAQ